MPIAPICCRCKDEIVTRIARGMRRYNSGRRRCGPRDARAPRAISMRRTWPYAARRACTTLLERSAEFQLAAFDLCDRALHIDNGNVFALTGMTLTTVHCSGHRSAEQRPARPTSGRADELVTLVRLPSTPNFYAAPLRQSLCLRGGRPHTQEAVAEGNAALALNPSYINAYVALCSANNFLGRSRIVPALRLADKAIRLSPRDPFLRELYHQKGMEAFFMENNKTIRPSNGFDGRKAATFSPTLYSRRLARVDRATGRRAPRSPQALSRGQRRVTSKTIAQLRKQPVGIVRPSNPKWVAYNERLFEGLRKAGMPEE